MKTRILLLMAFVAIGSGCKGNGDATKAVSPDQIGPVDQVDQLNQDYRTRSALAFLDDSHELRDLKVVNGTDPRILNARLITRQGYRGATYDLKIVVRGPYNEKIALRQRGTMIPRGNQNLIDLLMPSQVGMAFVGELASIVKIGSESQCALLKVNFSNAMVGETRLLLCEEISHNDRRYDDDDRDDRRDNRRGRRY